MSIATETSFPIPNLGRLRELNGSLGDVNAFELYRRIYLSRETGVLELRHSGTIKQIIFRNGSVVFAASTDDSEKLGNALVRAGRISSEQSKIFVEESRKGKRFGQILVERGILSQKELDHYARLNQNAVALSALQWEEGLFEFHPEKPSEFSDVFVNLSTADIIFEGVRRIQDADRVGKLLADPGTRVGLASDPLLRFQKISLTPQEAYVFSRIEGVMSISEICQVSALDEIFTLKVVLGLIMTGILETLPQDSVTELIAEVRPDVASMEECAQSAGEIDSQLVSEIGVLRERVKGTGLHEILGVAPGASADDLKLAYFRWAKRFHPDRYSRSAPLEVLQTSESVFRSVADAYRLVSDPAGQANSDLSTEGQPDISQKETAPDASASTHVSGKRAFEEGLSYYNRGEYLIAMEKFREAVRIDEGMAPYRFYLAETIAQIPQRRREAEFHYKLAIQQAPWNAEYHISLGQLYQQVGLQHRAHSCFVKAYELDPKNETLARMGVADLKRKNLFTRLFGR